MITQLSYYAYVKSIDYLQQKINYIMAIRLSSNCNNCAELSAEALCNVHQVKVSGDYTCDSFTRKPEMNEDRQCTTCSRHETASCAHPDKATEGMLCVSWAPAMA